MISNYRPISLLSVVSKLCERCILDKLIPKLLELLSLKQHGFVPRKSCVTQLLTVFHNLGKTLDAGQESDVLYLNFGKVFDSVPHNLLLHKLSLYGINGILYSWFSNYLHSRYQNERVHIEGSFSSWVNVSSGVPQGSLMGPFLFVIFINNLPKTLSDGTAITCLLMMPNVTDQLMTLAIVLIFNMILTSFMTGPLDGV